MKLLVLGKAGTLTRTKSGHTFVQHPEDQVLVDGVAEAIAAYAADGWTMAIASNQGGCEIRECEAKDIPIGAYYLHPPLMNPRKITNVEPKENGTILTWEEPDQKKHNWIFVHNGIKRKFQYKTIDMAIAEMQYAMELTGICIGMFCPDDGQSAYLVDSLSSCKYSDTYPKYIGTFRKPQGGMLNALRYSRNPSLQDIIRTSKGLELLPASEDDRYRYLMVGDRDEDFGAAVNAGFGYIHVSAWLEPFVK